MAEKSCHVPRYALQFGLSVRPLMEQALSGVDLDLYHAIKRLLYEEWDPIGVRGVAAARDEYSSYLPQVFALVQNNNGVASIAGFLSYVRVSRMGLPENDASDIEVAEMLLKQREAIYGSAA